MGKKTKITKLKKIKYSKKNLAVVFLNWKELVIEFKT
jgi:hypothetical protein